MVLKVASGGPLNGPVYYQGTWDANANTPYLQSGVGFTGEYYIVSVAGNTTLDGISNWQVGDWAIFNGATNKWEKIDGGSYGTTLKIVNDTSSNTTYNIAMTSSSSGLVDTEYVDNGNLTFNPSVGGGGPFSGALHTPSIFVSGYIVIGDPGSTILSGWEAYPDGWLVFYKSNVGAGTYDRSLVTNPNNWLGIGVDGGGQEEPPVYAPLYVQSTTANPQVMIANGTNAAHGLSIYVDGYQNASITNYNSANLSFGTNNITKFTINTSGAWGIGSSPNYGTSGQVLTSQGSGSAPVWSTLITTPIVTKTSNYTATANDETILVNAASGVATITLPTAVGVAGKVYTVKKIDSSTNAVTVATTSSQTIDGLTTYSLTNQYGGVNVQSDGSNWYIIANIFGRNGTTGTF